MLSSQSWFDARRAQRAIRSGHPRSTTDGQLLVARHPFTNTFAIAGQY